MIPHHELTELLRSKLGNEIPPDRIERIAADIAALEDTWEEVPITHSDMGYSVAVGCADICWLADQIDHGAVFKIFRKKSTP